MHKAKPKFVNTHNLYLRNGTANDSLAVPLLKVVANAMPCVLAVSPMIEFDVLTVQSGPKVYIPNIVCHLSLFSIWDKSQFSPHTFVSCFPIPVLSLLSPFTFCHTFPFTYNSHPLHFPSQHFSSILCLLLSLPPNTDTGYMGSAVRFQIEYRVGVQATNIF